MACPAPEGGWPEKPCFLRFTSALVRFQVRGHSGHAIPHVGLTMQINRLNPAPILPNTLPATLATGAGVPANSSGSDAAEGGDGVKAGLLQRAAPPVLTNPINKPAAASANEGVLLQLGSAGRAAGAGVYTRDGIVPSRIPAMLQTPAEQFVTSAVQVMREFEANAGLGANGAMSAASRAAAAAFGGVGAIKQAVSRLNVFA